MIEAEVICDSIAEHSPRLTTFRLRYPKWIHGEYLTHRSFSRNASSSRAIPVGKNLEEVRGSDLRARPEAWPVERKGMQGGDDLDADALARAMNIWDHAANDAAYHAERLARVGVHKSIVNRMIEPYLHINVVMTSCEPGLMNFFGLRLDKAAQPEIRVLAERMWAAWRESEPKVLQPGQWHLPFVHHMEDMGKSEKYDFYQNSTDILKDYYFSVATRVSAARCARISYLSFETGRPSTIEEDLRLFDRLAGSQPMHLSPLEHQATPDFWIKQPIAGPTAAEWNTVHAWANPHQHGNTPGWIQHRKMIPGEAVAALPEEYTR